MTTHRTRLGGIAVPFSDVRATATRAPSASRTGRSPAHLPGSAVVAASELGVVRRVGQEAGDEDHRDCRRGARCRTPTSATVRGWGCARSRAGTGPEAVRPSPAPGRSVCAQCDEPSSRLLPEMPHTQARQRRHGPKAWTANRAHRKGPLTSSPDARRSSTSALRAVGPSTSTRTRPVGPVSAATRRSSTAPTARASCTAATSMSMPRAGIPRSRRAAAIRPAADVEIGAGTPGQDPLVGRQQQSAPGVYRDGLSRRPSG